MLGKLTEVQIENILSSQALGRLACTDGKQPYIVPVTYVYDGKYIYGQTNEGMKLEIVRKNPLVCFEVDQMTDMRNWKSVIVYGKFSELNDEEAEKVRGVFSRGIFSVLTNSTVHPFQHETTASIDDGTRVKQVMYRIVITERTGRFEKQ